MTRIEPQTVAAIRAAVDSGKRVTCDGGGYEVIKDKLGQYLIHFKPDYYIGLSGREGTPYAEKLNGREFYVEE